MLYFVQNTFFRLLSRLLTHTYDVYKYYSSAVIRSSTTVVVQSDLRKHRDECGIRVVRNGLNNNFVFTIRHTVSVRYIIILLLLLLSSPSSSSSSIDAGAEVKSPSRKCVCMLMRALTAATATTRYSSRCHWTWQRAGNGGADGRFSIRRAFRRQITLSRERIK